MVKVCWWTQDAEWWVVSADAKHSQGSVPVAAFGMDAPLWNHMRAYSSGLIHGQFSLWFIGVYWRLMMVNDGGTLWWTSTIEMAGFQGFSSKMMICHWYVSLPEGKPSYQEWSTNHSLIFISRGNSRGSKGLNSPGSARLPPPPWWLLALPWCREFMYYLDDLEIWRVVSKMCLFHFFPTFMDDGLIFHRGELPPARNGSSSHAWMVIYHPTWTVYSRGSPI